MSSFPSDFVFPIYISLATKEEYVAKNDIYAYYRSQFEDILKKVGVSCVFAFHSHVYLTVRHAAASGNQELP